MDPEMDPNTTPGMMPPDPNYIPQFDAPYNWLQIGTVISFGVTYLLASGLLGLRFFQALKLVRKIEVDLGE